MWQRAGMNAEQITVCVLEEWNGSVPSHIKTIIPMGELALQRVCGESDLFRWRGRRFYRAFPAGHVLMCPTLLPSQMLPYVGQSDNRSQLSLRPTRFQGAWVFDVQRAFREQGHVEISQPVYLKDPAPAEFATWAHEALAATDAKLSFDIETHYKLDITDESEFEEEELKMGAMLRISFAYKPHHAVSIPWNREYFDTIRLLLESEMPKVVWNGAQFDVPRLREEGFPVNGVVYDMQDGWHLLESDQPKGLEYVSSFYTCVKPWKHLNNAQPALYSCIDADIALQNAIGIESDLKYFGQWDLYLRHVVTLMPILDRAGLRGNMVNTQYGQELVNELEQLKKEMLAKAQMYVPDLLKPRKRFKREPQPEEGRTFVPVQVMGTLKQCSHCKQVNVKKSDHFKGGKKNACKVAGAEINDIAGLVTEWDEILPFNPASSEQLKDYMRHYKHPRAKDRKTGNESANGKHIEKLAARYGQEHPLYGMVVEYSKVAKTLSTYIYKPDSEGLIHTTYVNAPSTWRLASRNVNLQNVPKRESNKWAKLARRQIVARPGHVFVQADSTSIEAVLTGWLINDENFIQVAKKSIHAYLCCQELGWDFTDANIERVKKEQKKLYNQFKTAVYLLLYGGDPYLMFMTNPEQFPTKADAELIQNKIFNMMPALKSWQDQTREQAKKEGELRSPWGYRHKFYDVYTFKRDSQGHIEYHEDGKPKMKMGQDAKRALAFKPQNSAGAFCRDTLVLMGQSKWAPYMSANVSVHDGYTLEVPTQLADDAVEYLIDVLTRPIPELGGLRIGCEVDMGKNWADYSSDNPDGMKTLRKVEV
jgi:DNA polymerase I-like protein with 3'-5' exonuclease and polymerase domains